MITDSKNVNWVPNEERSIWVSSLGGQIYVNPETTDEQLLASIEQLYLPPPVEKSDAERIAELEAKLSQLLSKLSNP